MDVSSVQPIIVVGMHRSGTSLLARLLRDMGVFIGSDCDSEHAESVSMRELNEVLLEKIGATWYQPDVADVLFNYETHCPDIVDTLRSGLESSLSIFSGDRQVSSSGLCQPWGWKDPRTTLTLPVWLSLFPKAKVINIVRNGVDVAQSLVTRDRRRIRERRMRRFKALCRGDLLQPAGRYVQRAVGKSSATLGRNPGQFDLTKAFSVWTAYLDVYQHWLELVSPEQRLSLRYEDLLSNPQLQLLRLQEFTGCTNRDRSPDLAASIRSCRGTAFASDSKLWKFYQKVRSHPQMVAHGYANLTWRAVG